MSFIYDKVKGKFLDKQQSQIMFSKNLKFLRTNEGLTQEQLAEELGYKRTVYKDYEYDKEPDVALLMKVSDYFSVAVDDLLKKNLEAKEKKKTLKKSELIDQENNIRVLAVTVDSEDRENIEYVPVKARAGYLAGYGDALFISELKKFHFPHPQLNRGTFRAFEISGDSMPPVANGSVVIGKYVDNWRDIKNLKTYILLTKDDGVVYKRVINKVRDKKKLILLSDNPLYEPYTVDIDDVLEIWSYEAHVSFQSDSDNNNLSLQVLAKLQEMEDGIDNIGEIIEEKKGKRK